MDQELYYERALQILERLNEITPQAYIIGGAVRDHLLGLPFNDIDIATSAKPEEVLSIFPNGKDGFKDYGCIVLEEDGMVFEITTFREEEYSNGVRKPSSIHYSQKLIDDVNRRDFTISAIALSKNEKIVDCVDGLADLNNKIIRCIGKPKVRFKEDPIRILRGLSLVGKYNFKIERHTLLGMKNCRKLLETISEAKFTSTMYSILNSTYGKSAVRIIYKNDLFSFDEQLQGFIKLIYKNYKKLSVLEMFTILYYLKGSVSEESCFSKSSKLGFKTLIYNIDYLKQNEVNSNMIFKLGFKLSLSCDKLASILDKTYKSQKKLIKKIYKKLPVKTMAEFNITNEELVELNYNSDGLIIKTVMNQLIEECLSGKLKNINEELRYRAKLLLTNSHDRSE